MSAIALSPGVDYHGVVSDVSIENLADEQRVLLMASSEDVYSFESIEELHELNRSQTSISRQSGAGHGTMMFLKKSELYCEAFNSAITVWFKDSNGDIPYALPDCGLAIK